jgi:hypothetical protein
MGGMLAVLCREKRGWIFNCGLRVVWMSGDIRDCDLLSLKLCWGT